MVDPLSSALAGVLGATFSALHQWAVEKAADRNEQQRRRRALGDHAKLLAAAGNDLADLRRAEFATLPDGDWHAAQHAVAESLQEVVVGRLIQTEPAVLTDAARLRARVRTAGKRALASAALGDQGIEAYQRLLDECCRRIALRARAVDEVMRALQVDVATQVTTIREGVDELARQSHQRDRLRADAFERRYVSYVADDHATFELFQVSVGRAPTRYRFSDFYAVPSIARRLRSESDTELTGAGTNGAHAIASAQHVLLLGGAGAGKTTFLHWLAHTEAAAVRDRRDGADDARQYVVPFFVSLRQFADRDLPEPEDLVRVTAPALAGEKPDGWVSALLRFGRAMLLVDGVDELLLGRREDVRRWLGGLLRAYPLARYVVTTRPSAVSEDWLAPSRPDASDGLARYELLPLSGHGLRDLIGHWFTAARASETEPEQREWLTSCEHRLIQALSTRPDTRTLVSSPLLCSLLCALYRKENMYLPQSRKELLDRALELLLGEWDVRRGVQVEDELRMSEKEKIILLERFAAPMVRNSELLVRHDEAEKRFGRAMSGLRSQGVPPALVLRHMLERTGLMRESAVDGKIQFVHRTFRDFLAAGEFVKAGELGYLIDHAHDDSLNEVIFMAAAQARAREAGELLLGLLARAGKGVTRKDQEVADRLELIAAAALGYVDVIDPEHVRTDVMAAARRLIPPAGLEEAELLARAGSFVIDLLPGPIEVGKHAEESGGDPAAIAACVIRTLAMIGGEEAWDKIQAFSDTHRGAVINELLRAWRQNEYSEDYARTLLSNVDFGDLVLKVHRWDVLPRLKHLRTLTAVQLIGNIAIADRSAGLYPLADLPALRHLEIRSNEVLRSLRGLAGCVSLRSVWISGYANALRDLSTLAELNVTELRLHIPGYRGGSVPALKSLTGAGLQRLSIRHPQLADGLHPLPDDLPLTELAVDMRPERRSLLGIERWPTLTTVSAQGIPTAEEVRELSRLPALRQLTLNNVQSIEDLVRLRPLGSLRIELFNVPSADVQTARDALPDADLVLHVVENVPPTDTR
ncbi:NACHT domain-containing protein [Kibdelosporangium sp. 4NS15]|uniref:NACHT domain-containing protein n=1 Tax=Kibdelosporangium persicum TaxID=2698649 RepID=A0ABX2F387_9PSEU|nr:NACHT domain-containing protein [Kibdelosporangium persicum]NRN65796.1 NACHT domain-containing protein [Kibdelosporangium persicum]